MASFELTSVPMWLTGCTYDADGGNDLRNSGIAALTYPAGPAGGSSSGVLAGVLGAGLGVTAASGMTVHVNGGSFIVSNPTAAGGGYSATLASQAALTVASADPVNPRVDLVCCTVVDNGNSSSYGMVQVVTGTPASSPAAPATPASSARLALISVPALATSVVSGDIQDVRSYTCAVGGIVTQPIEYNPPGYNGCYGYDAPSDRLYHNSATGVRQPHVLPFAAGTSSIDVNALIGSGGTAEIFLTVNPVVTDGATDLRITYHIPGVSMASPQTAQVKFQIVLDGTVIDETDVFTYSIDQASVSGHGFTGVMSTGNGIISTPAAGSHSVTLQAVTTAANDAYVVCSSIRQAYLMIEAQTL